MWWCGGAVVVRSGGVHPGPSLAALQCAALVLGQPTPDAGVLARAESPVQARLHHRAATADGLGLLDLHDRRAGRPDREEQLGVLVPAERAVAPIHGGVLLGVVYGCPSVAGLGPRFRADTGCPALWLSDCSSCYRLVAFICDVFTSRTPVKQIEVVVRPLVSKLTTGVLGPPLDGTTRRSRPLTMRSGRA